MKLTIKHQITTALVSPFILTKVPIALSRKSIRSKFRCGYKALTELSTLKLDPTKYYGADVCDSNGVTVAELE